MHLLTHSLEFLGTQTPLRSAGQRSPFVSGLGMGNPCGDVTTSVAVPSLPFLWDAPITFSICHLAAHNTGLLLIPQPRSFIRVLTIFPVQNKLLLK